jgi:O-antigen/teichoic acid export membrane protein
MIRRWAKNSFANLASGAIGALYNFALPALLSRSLSKGEYSAWALALQMTAYINLFGMGLQTATGRFVAEADASGNQEKLLAVANAAKKIINVSTLLAVAAVAILVVVYPEIFSALPDSLKGMFRITVLALGLSTALQLKSLLPIGIFTGLHKNILFVAAQATAKIITVIGLWICTGAGASIAVIALTFALLSTTTLPLLAFIARRTVPWYRQVTARPAFTVTGKELLKFCVTLSVWSICTIMVTSVSTIVVGIHDFSHVASYSIAVTMNSIFVGLLSALMSPLMTSASAMSGTSSGREQIPRLLTRATFIGTVLLHLSLIIFIPLGPWFLKLWVGGELATDAYQLAVLLLIANVIRNHMLPYSYILLSLSMHRLALITAIAEGVISVALSFTLASVYGARGVAIASIVAATIGVLSLMVITFPRTRTVLPSIPRFLSLSMLVPLLFALPFYIYYFIKLW